jgi:DNA modification methylase
MNKPIPTGQIKLVQPVPFRLEGEVQPHWIVERYFLPLPNKDETSPLATSIETTGQIDPIVLYEDRILEGRERYRMKRHSGEAVWAIRFDDTPQGQAAAAQGTGALDKAAYDYAFAKNLARRHYTPGQLSLMAAKRANMRQGERTDLEPSDSLPKVSQQQAAKDHGVHVRSVGRAEYVLEQGTPEEIQMIVDGVPLEPVESLIRGREKKREAELRRQSCPNLHVGPSRIIQGDALKQLRGLDDRTAQLIVTSPPYYHIRNFGVDGQIGLESTPEEFISKLVAVFRESRRVLKDDGTLWINIGDTYEHKSLIDIPGMLGAGLRNDGWYWRDRIVLAKTNPIPESASDRTTNSYEFVLMFAKHGSYYYDQDAIAEPATSCVKAEGTPRTRKLHSLRREHYTVEFKTTTRKRRNVWEISRQLTGTDHVATFSEEVARLPILCGSRVGDVVLDPFLGSGTTAVVAKKLGRHYIGIELNPEYVTIAEGRLAAADAPQSKVARVTGSLTDQPGP